MMSDKLSLLFLVSFYLKLNMFLQTKTCFGDKFQINIVCVLAVLLHVMPILPVSFNQLHRPIFSQFIVCARNKGTVCIAIYLRG